MKVWIRSFPWTLPVGATVVMVNGEAVRMGVGFALLAHRLNSKQDALQIKKHDAGNISCGDHQRQLARLPATPQWAMRSAVLR